MSTATAASHPLAVRARAIPAELRQRPQWVAFALEARGDLQTKVPLDARTGRRAESNNSTTWTDFDTALAYASMRANVAGVGYVFAPDDPYTGVDFDHSCDRESGEIDEWAKAVIGTLNSYTERSPSGAGLHTIVRARLPGGGIRRKRPGDIPGGVVEMYDQGRFFTVTGHHIPGTPTAICDAQEAVSALYARLTAPTPVAARQPQPTERAAQDRLQAQRDALLDEDLIALARNARNGEKFAALWMGDTGGYVSHSEADIALCSMLAFYTGPDPARIDRLFRRSLLHRAKWDEMHGAETYGQRTVAQAIAARTEYWTPGEHFAAGHEAQAARGVRVDSPPPEVWTPKIAPWPAPLAEEAYHGLAGEIVHAIDPHTEADPVAVLLQLPVATGNLIGRTPHFMAEADRHGLNLFAVQVGESSKGRKGTSFGHVRRICEAADEQWTATCILDGLSSARG